MNTGCVVGQTRERLPTLPFPEAVDLRNDKHRQQDPLGDFALGILQSA